MTMEIGTPVESREVTSDTSLRWLIFDREIIDDRKYIIDNPERAQRGSLTCSFWPRRTQDSDNRVFCLWPAN